MGSKYSISSTYSISGLIFLLLNIRFLSSRIWKNERFKYFGSEILRFHLFFTILNAIFSQLWGTHAVQNCRTKVDKSQLYIPHQKQVETWGFSSLSDFGPKIHFRIFPNFVHQNSSLTWTTSSDYFPLSFLTVYWQTLHW